MYRIRVKPDHRWNTARVSGRIFSKAGQEYADGYVNDEIANSDLLEVAKIELAKPKRKPKKAKKEAGDG